MQTGADRSASVVTKDHTPPGDPPLGAPLTRPLSGTPPILTAQGSTEGERYLVVSLSLVPLTLDVPCPLPRSGRRGSGQGRGTNIICADGTYLFYVLSGGLRLTEVLRAKARQSAETGCAFVPLRELLLDDLT